MARAVEAISSLNLRNTLQFSGSHSGHFVGLKSLFIKSICFVLSPTCTLRYIGATLGTETFTDLDYADDVALLAEMLEVLLLALDVLRSPSSWFRS